ncbi:MAG: hypothetical protein M1548_05440 [Actinobacteria bacterium]|nr:hypothetical protein [Actinomycetota bacterium]
MDELPAELLTRIKEASIEKRISCSVARRIAEELKVPMKKAGEAADELGIKIYACELGCF